MTGASDLLERIFWEGGYHLVAGVDEVGRGPLAGEVVAAAVAVLPGTVLPQVNDSKLVAPGRRRVLAEAIAAAAEVGIGIATVEEIARLNILGATRLAMLRALEALPNAPQFVLVDGNPVRDLPWPQMSVIKGDRLCRAVAAASILAKVHRDAMMERYDELYPGYGFAAHKGYGCESHLRAIQELGPCPIHRTCFAGVRQGRLFP